MSPFDATIAYVLASIVNISTAYAPLSSSNPSRPSVACCIGLGEAGLLISIICTPLSIDAATMAYVLAPIVNVSTSLAPASVRKVSSVSEPAGEG